MKVVIKKSPSNESDKCFNSSEIDMANQYIIMRLGQNCGYSIVLQI
jgi:hypothetical protein